jgi:hypothetical protein
MNSSIPTGSNFVKNTFNKSKNTIYQGYQQFSTLSVISQVFTFLIGLLLIGLVIYIFYYFYAASRYGTTTTPMFIDAPVNAFDGTLSGQTRQIPLGTEGLAFTYNFWIYIADWQYKFGEKKIIFVKGLNGPEVALAANQNSLGIRLRTFAQQSGETCNLDNIPLQKWVNIAIVLDNRTLDTYIDGRLERSCVLQGVPQLNKNPITFVPDGGFYGQLAKFRYFNRAISPDEAYSIYSLGPY